VNSGNQINRPVQMAHTIAELLDHLLFEPYQLAQLQQRRLRQLSHRRPLLRRKAGDPDRVNGVGLGAL
jgi:hypothetical protein